MANSRRADTFNACCCNSRSPRQTGIDPGGHGTDNVLVFSTKGHSERQDPDKLAGMTMGHARYFL